MGESKRRLRGMLPDETALIFNEKTSEFRVVMAHDRPDLTSMHKGSAAIVAVAIKLQKDPQWVDDLISTYLTKRETAAPEPVEHKMSAGDVSNGALLTGLNARPGRLAQLIPAVPSRDEILFAPYGRPENQPTPEQAADPYGYMMSEGIKKLAQAKAERKKVTFITSYTDLPDGTIELTVADQDRPASPYRVIVSQAEARRVLKDYPLEPDDVETPS